MDEDKRSKLYKMREQIETLKASLRAQGVDVDAVLKPPKELEDLTLREFRERFPMKPGDVVRSVYDRKKMYVTSWPWYDPDMRMALVCVVPDESPWSKPAGKECATLEPVVTLEAWRASRRWSSNLGEAIGDEAMAHVPSQGFAYAGTYWVELLDDGQFSTEFSNMFKSSVSLDEVESWLYAQVYGGDR
jgi:hypothetical protein